MVTPELTETSNELFCSDMLESPPAEAFVALYALMGAPLPVTSECRDRIVKAPGLPLVCDAFLDHDLQDIRRCLILCPCFKNVATREANRLEKAAACLIEFLSSTETQLFWEARSDELLRQKLATEISALKDLVGRAVSAKETKPKFVRELIAGPIAECYANAFNRQVGISLDPNRQGSLPAGPFVRFVDQVIEEFAPRLGPVNPHRIREAKRDWDKKQKLAEEIIRKALKIAEPAK